MASFILEAGSAQGSLVPLGISDTEPCLCSLDLRWGLSSSPHLCPAAAHAASEPQGNLGTALWQEALQGGAQHSHTQAKSNKPGLKIEDASYWAGSDVNNAELRIKQALCIAEQQCPIKLFWARTLRSFVSFYCSRQ